MARALWTGAISFGLVNIPVKLLSAVQDSTLDLDMLDSRDHSNIRFKRVNENTGREVNYSDIVRGYMINDKYVVLDKEDFVNADVVKTKTIDIQNFVLEEEIESIYYEQPYYLQPDKSGEKAYGLLRDALRQSGKVGLATFVLRNREALVIIKPYEKVIVLNRIRFAQEIRDTKGIATPAALKPKSPELAMATKLIDQLTTKFNISKYKDTYTEKLLKLIKAKAKTKGKGKLKAPAKLKIVHTKKDDLMDALKASLTKRRKAS
jgi:DNA end-binding protein Ku